MVVAIAAVSVLVLSVRGAHDAARSCSALAFVTLLVIGLALGVSAHRLPGRRARDAVHRAVAAVIELGRRLRDGLAVASRPRTMVGAVILSLAAWTASTITFLAGGQAVGIELTVAQGALIGSGVALASIVPAGPGYVGTFELTAVAIAQGLGIDRDAAFAMALLIHATILLVTSVGGVVAIVALRRRRRRPAGRRIDEPPA